MLWYVVWLTSLLSSVDVIQCSVCFAFLCFLYCGHVKTTDVFVFWLLSRQLDILFHFVHDVVAVLISHCILTISWSGEVSLHCHRDGHGSGRPAGRVGSGRVGSGRGSESRQIWRVGSGRNFWNALFFSLSVDLSKFSYCSQHWVL